MNQRKAKVPRAASSYRGARRNACLRGDVKGVWPGMPARYVPFMLKPPVFKAQTNAVSGLPVMVPHERKQPKTYPYSSKRQTRGGRRRPLAA